VDLTVLNCGNKYILRGAWWCSGIIAQPAVALPWQALHGRRLPASSIPTLRRVLFFTAIQTISSPLPITCTKLFSCPPLTLHQHHHSDHPIPITCRWTAKKSSHQHHAAPHRSQACRRQIGPWPLPPGVGTRKNGRGRWASEEHLALRPIAPL
jgi:hypothetical protein